MSVKKTEDYIRWFETLSSNDINIAGGKNANLGEMYSKLTDQGVEVPNGFAITADAYKYMITQANAWEKLHDALDFLKPNEMDKLKAAAETAREIVYNCPIPNHVQLQILKAFAKLKQQYGNDVTVAVRSSATGMYVY